MPVRFKGLSEYQRNFLWKKSYLTESYNPSVGQRYPWAGLRSDQLDRKTETGGHHNAKVALSVMETRPWQRITREPSFISKRRVPCPDPQISKSLEWNGPIPKNDVATWPEPNVLESARSQEPELKAAASGDGVPVLEALRTSEKTRTHSADSQAKVDNNQDGTADHTPGAGNVEPECPPRPLPESVDGRLDRFLRKKAGLVVPPSQNVLRNSEYQRQFVWKTPKQKAPVFTANQVFHNKSKFVPQLKGNSTIHETEYKRNFKGLSPVKEPKSRSNFKEIRTPEKQCNKVDDPIKLEEEMELKDSNQPKKKLSPWRHQRLGKVNSEYRAKFLSPSQYLYKAGAWTHVKENIPNQGSVNAVWYAEVRELREKAEFYRRRVQGTHFSRDHLNQILSDSNRCWDVSSTTSSEGTISSNIRALDLAGDPTSHKALQKCSSTKLEEKEPALEEQPQKELEHVGVPDEPTMPTMPVRRRLAWDAENTHEDIQKQPAAEEEDLEEEEMERDRQAYVGEPEKLEVHEKSKADKIKEGSESSSVTSGKGGRLPTPKLRELGGLQRTHHDLTTPAVGGAVLVSPSKAKLSGPELRKKLTCQDAFETPKTASRKKESRALSLLTSPAAGIKTLDPLPLREDSEVNITTFAEAALPTSKVPDCSAHTPGQGQPQSPQPSFPPYAPPYWNPTRRIQGSLRHPEFQHNVGKSRMKHFQLRPHEAFNDEDEDRLSEISARSAASSLRAFQTLARAQKRKDNFWGKA